MECNAFVSGANVVIAQIGDKKLGMTCAWAMMADYDKALMLIGSQSDTGNSLKAGMIIGISGLASDQKDIALHFGKEGSHSLAENKFVGEKIEKLGDAYVISGAKTMSEAKVIKVLRLPDDADDNLVYVQIISFQDDSSKDFVLLKDIF